MKGLYKRIISGVLVLVTIFLTCSPVAFASSEGSLESYQPGTFWGWLQSINNSSWNFWKSLIDKDTCAKSPNTNGLHEFVKTTTTVDGKTGLYYVCRYCGKSAGEVGEEAYQQQVSELPASGYSSSGDLLFTVPLSSHEVYGAFNSPVRRTCSGHTVAIPSFSNSMGLNLTFSCASDIISGSLASGYSSGDVSGITVCTGDFSFPYTGYYQRLGFPAIELQFFLPADKGFEKRIVSKSWSAASSPVFYEAGYNFSGQSISCVFSSSAWTQVSSFRAQCYPLVFKFIPAPDSDFNIGDTYNITTRPTAINGGNYGIIGDNNQITTITDNLQIINEGDNLYYNPATGQTYTITDWTYNYDGRIYNITLDTGDTVSVEYGDENITIVENNVVEGDTIVNNYTIYYIIDGGGSGDTPSPPPTVCPHEWYKTGERQATCLIPAQRTYTCSICGEQKTETDPVLGHSWHVIQTVTTQYDENGNMTQEGYTIYECERCGEQYKSTNDTGPPPSGGGGSGGGSSDNIFSGIFGLIWDFFTFLFDLFSGFVVGGIKGFIDGLKDAGSSFFSILNPFNWDYGG